MMLQALVGLLLQLSFFSLVSASPVSISSNNVGGGVGGGIVGFIVLVLDIIVWIEVLQSNRPVANKVLWCLLVFLFPIVGMIVYYLFSNREQHNTRGGYEAIPGA
ncbi:hypothetical protein P154DRAFT_533218 [Amniculicola lignicola CBS 123094]|uniref:Cardiolipin synthase N-terminal domain-containing protein n=1 Tax=Amniculicola lignicola CBS 123094 TaxID=1392246 RepID=A0A6A5WQ59_9PLEO|nr:hypothetical protein P154DRAFT_533218 [Amniculicola lignicola CBS 123094]